MPVSRVGPSAKAATAARVCAVSEICDRSASMPCSGPVPCTVMLVSVRSTRAPMRSSRSTNAHVALQGLAAEALDPDAATDDRGGGEGVRRRAGVGLDDVGGGAVRLRRDAPGARVRAIHLARRSPPSRPRSCRRRAGRRGPRPSWTVSPSRMAGAASSNPERNWLETSPDTVISPPAAGTAADLDRQVAGCAGVDDRDAQRPQRVDGRAHRPGPQGLAAVDPYRARCRAPPPAAGSGWWCRTGGRRRGPRRRAAAHRTRTPGRSPRTRRRARRRSRARRPGPASPAAWPRCRRRAARRGGCSRRPPGPRTRALGW